MEGKWFAQRAAEAAEWGRRFYGEEQFHILQTRAPTSYGGNYSQIRI
jgi:hypothetical protein